ncbi:MAG: arsenate reductase ArsC [Sedimentisphaerales bacterium]
MSDLLKILFLCTGNSCRSQMAEGFARRLKGNLISSFSAGIKPKGLDSNAVEVMKEIGIDISGHKSKTIEELGSVEFDYVITLCDSAQKNCPFFPAKYGIIHHGFDDPIRLASNETGKQNILKHYRRVRDEIRMYIQTMPASLIGQKDSPMSKSQPSN